MSLPNKIERVSFGRLFNSHFNGPCSLRVLKFGNHFNQKFLCNDGLEVLHVGNDFQQNMLLPPSLRFIYVSRFYGATLTLSEGCEAVFFTSCLYHRSKKDLSDAARHKLGSHMTLCITRKEKINEIGYPPEDDVPQIEFSSSVKYTYMEEWEQIRFYLLSKANEKLQSMKRQLETMEDRRAKYTKHCSYASSRK